MVNAVTLLALLGRRLDGLDFRRVLAAFGKVVIASLIMGLAAATSHEWLVVNWGVETFLSRLGAVGVSIAVGVFVFVSSARLLRLRELDEGWDQLLAKIGRS